LTRGTGGASLLTRAIITGPLMVSALPASQLAVIETP